MSRSSNDNTTCPVFASSGKCGEKDALEVMEQFRTFYETKLNEIDHQGGGDCLELKLKIQRRWIDDLTEQTQMMARIVKELEAEATNRVRMLEDKLKQNSKSAYEVMKRYQNYSITHNLDEPFQKIFYLENDMKNLLEFIRRIREDRKWSIDGLQFYDVTYRDLFGKERCDCDDKEKNLLPVSYKEPVKKKEPLSSTNDDDESIDENENSKVCDDVFEQLKKKTEEYEALKQSMLDMRSALTEEVACKHDMISALKKDIQQLEERCVQADKQTAFKDDIIKELRKEIKQLKHQRSPKEEELRKQLEEAQNLIKRMKPCVNVASTYTDMDDKSGAKKRERDLEDEIGKRQREVDDLKRKCRELEATLESSQGRAENLQKADARYCGRSEIKKLRHQIHYYEHVIDCFKHEMTVMSEQLANLQDILNLSNKSCKEENSQLQNAVFELQKLSDKLKAQLVDTEKKALMENQMNQLKDAKIDELQLIIGQKNADLNMHDEAINEMKVRLENALVENSELQNTIVSLNGTIMQLQCTLDCRQFEQPAPCYAERETKCGKWERKWEKLQEEYREQYEVVKAMEKELHRVKEKSKDKMRHLKHQNEELKEKLATSELANQHLHKQLSNMRDQSKNVCSNDCATEHELAKSKQIIIELRQTLIELNESFAECDLLNLTLVDECHRCLPDCEDKNDPYLSCRLEITMYKKLAENLKDTLLDLRCRVSDAEARIKSLNEELRNKDARINEMQRRGDTCGELKNKLKELECRNKSLCDDLKCKEAKICEIQKKATKKEKEHCQCIQELTDKLQETRDEERRLSEFIDALKREVQKRIDDKKAVTNYCECNVISSTQEEIGMLKVEIKNMISNQLALNSENDKLLKEVTSLQNNVQCLDEKNRHMKLKLDRLQAENKNLKDKTKCLMRERETYAQTIRNLEVELADAKNNRDDLCAESRCVVDNVKAWLEEQRKINDKVKKKTQCYCDTIAKLKQENETLLTGRTYTKPKYERNYNKPCCTGADCPHVWFAGSQGSLNSPPDSPISCTCSVEEWYSPNFKDEETEDCCDEFIQTLEAVTQEIRQNNRKWNCKCQEFVVSKDKK